MVCYRRVCRRYDRDWFGVVATAPGITQRTGDEEMTHRRTIRDKVRPYCEAAIALAMMAAASFAGAGAAHWVFGP
jgi:hypothetical protein